MARTNGLKQIVKMTDERRKRLNARIAEHGVDAVIAAIRTIPESPFLMGGGDRGWKANFDWLLSPKYCVKLIEGGYHGDGTGRQSGWTGD